MACAQSFTIFLFKLSKSQREDHMPVNLILLLPSTALMQGPSISVLCGGAPFLEVGRKPFAHETPFKHPASLRFGAYNQSNSLKYSSTAELL